MLEFSRNQDDYFKHEVKIKCLCVSFDGTFYKNVFTIYVQSWLIVLTVLMKVCKPMQA